MFWARAWTDLSWSPVLVMKVQQAVLKTQCLVTAGKTDTACALSQHYDIPVLTIDDVITASLTSGTVNGLRARELCAEAARQRHGDEMSAADDRPPLSVDTLSTQTLGRYLVCRLYCL